MKRPALLIAALLLSSPAIAQDKGSFSVHQRLTRDNVSFFYPGGMFIGGSNQGMATITASENAPFPVDDRYFYRCLLYVKESAGNPILAMGACSFEDLDGDSWAFETNRVGEHVSSTDGEEGSHGELRMLGGTGKYLNMPSGDCVYKPYFLGDRDLELSVECDWHKETP